MRREWREWWIPRAVALALTAGYLALTFSRLRGDVVNSYPWLTLDGYDWIYEGQAVGAWLAGRLSVSLPLLRNPVFVLLTACDALFGGTGRLVLAAQASAFLAQLLLTIRFCELVETDLAVKLVAPIFLAGNALWAVRLHVSPDDVAIALMLWLVYALARWRRGGGDRWLAQFAVAAWLGTLTQPYAAVAAVVAVALAAMAPGARRGIGRLLVAAAAAALAGLLSARAWASLVPHNYVPDFWSLADPRLTQFAINRKIWVVAFWPLAGLFLVAAWRLRAAWRNRWEVLTTGALCLSFALATSAYRWPDARFTYIWCPFVVWFLCAALPRRVGEAGRFPIPESTAAAFALTGVLLFQALDWTPARAITPFGVPSLLLVPLPDVLKTRLADRFDLARRCGEDRRFCASAGPGRPKTRYDRVILCEYRRLHLPQAAGDACGDLLGMPCIRPAR